MLPQELIYKILYYYNGLQHPNAILIKDYMRDNKMIKYTEFTMTKKQQELHEYWNGLGIKYWCSDESRYITTNLNIMVRLDFPHLFDML